MQPQPVAEREAIICMAPCSLSAGAAAADGRVDGRHTTNRKKKKQSEAVVLIKLLTTICTVQPQLHPRDFY